MGEEARSTAGRSGGWGQNERREVYRMDRREREK
jgi:hypothetical protein